jgi:hypothetical protein
VVIALFAVACGGDDSGSSEEGTESESAEVEGTIDDPRLEPVCASRDIWEDMNALFNELPEDPAELEMAIAGIANELEAVRTAAPETMHEDLDALTEWWQGLADIWARYDYDLAEAEAATVDPFTLVLGISNESVVFAGTWVAMANELCIDDYGPICAERNNTPADCRCVEESFVTAVVETGLPRHADGTLDAGSLTEDCLDSYDDLLADWCGAYSAVTTVEDFVLDGRDDRSDLAAEIVTGEFTSEETDLAELVDVMDALVTASPEGVAPIVNDLAAWVDDWDAFWAGYDYAYAKIIDDEAAVDRYLAMNDDPRFAESIAALIALEETLCQGQEAWTGACLLRGGDATRCDCVWTSIADAVLSDGLPIGANGMLDVDAMTAECGAT